DFAELVTDLGWQRNGAWGGDEVIFQINPAHTKAELPDFLVQNACCISDKFLLRAGIEAICGKRRRGRGSRSDDVVGSIDTRGKDLTTSKSQRCSSASIPELRESEASGLSRPEG